MHEHGECKHDLKYCPICDVVYCAKCDKEWGGHAHARWIWYPYYPYSRTVTYPQTVSIPSVWTGDNTTQIPYEFTVTYSGQ
jgi:hypothetical protein